MTRHPHGPLQVRTERLVTRWQVQDSHLRRHTPTDSQKVDALALTCGFTAISLHSRTYSLCRRPLTRQDSQDSPCTHDRAPARCLNRGRVAVR